ncbi:EcoKI restriction-modification system protein HsdS [Posidoniimonas corsicana]|uniref:EcoKI restriction-modification system protein HsdS n=1 Tax=Posidoniimonas corsicana TaxID=1938618 RepID=A0A5C5V5U2_9BACT|nr:restriction endonuclease subunit S [Posidoniimonas corsicana]TWT33908.1 EcoKI restriction-modification system protein HsdS [Posidoniimonas corsicana]
MTAAGMLPRFLDNLDAFVAAPGAVAKLREMILDLAVRGKLVEQHQGDAPAAELLEQVSLERMRLVENGKLRKRRVPPPPGNEEVPHELPIGWEWTRFSILGEVGPRNSIDDSSEVSFLPMATISDGYAGTISPEVRSWGDVKKGFTHVADGDIAMAKITPCFQNRKSAVILGLKNGVGAGTTELHVLRPIGDAVLPEYALLHLKSLSYLEVGVSKMTGSAGQKRVPTAYFSETPFPLPPLAEQLRIVAKVDSLMSMCDELEAQQQREVDLRQRASQASLHALTAATDRSEIQSAWRRLNDHFETLYDTPETIDDLRQTILQLAVQGKLVEQDPKDEPSSKLLDRTYVLPKDYKRGRKLVKKTPVNVPSGLFAELPESWEYAVIQDLYDRNIIVDFADGNHGSLYPRKNEFANSGVIFVSAKDLVDGRVQWSTCSKLNRDKANQLVKGWSQGGDVLLTHNATVGRVARVEGEVAPFLLGTSVTFYRLNDAAIDRNYFYIVLRSQVWQEQMAAIMSQTTRNQVSIQKQAFFQIPVPPLNEQQRIVDKVDQMLASCDALRAQHEKRVAITEKMLAAMVHRLLEEDAA